MPEVSGPRVTGTLAERQFDDLIWRDLFGTESGVINDMDGSAYKVTLPSSGNVVTFGSTSQASLSVVGGFRHRISAGDTQTVTLPAMGGAARTDIVVARLDLATFTGAPGPVRLTPITGTSTSIPMVDDSAPGVEDLPLWAFTRQPGQTAAQAVVTRLFTRLSRVRGVAPGAPLPLTASLDSVAIRDGVEYRRVLGSASVPEWKEITTVAPTVTAFPGAFGWGVVTGYAKPGFFKDSSGVVHGSGAMRSLSARSAGSLVGRLPTGYRPNAIEPLQIDATTPSAAVRFDVAPSGDITLVHAIGADVAVFLNDMKFNPNTLTAG